MREVAMCLNAKGGGGRIDAESETFVTTLRGHSDYGDGMPSLRAGGGGLCRWIGGTGYAFPTW